MTTKTDRGRVDGRTARRDRNKLAVLDAVIELFSEENLTPGVHEVAERSGVSLRSVYRYFEDVDDLIAAAIDRQLEMARPAFEMPDIGEGTLTQRIDRFTRRRVELFEQVSDVYRASSIRAADQSQVSAGLRQARKWLADQTHAMFAPELTALDGDSATVGRMIDTLSQFDALHYLRADLGLSVDETIAHLRASFERTLS